MKTYLVQYWHAATSGMISILQTDDLEEAKTLVRQKRTEGKMMFVYDHKGTKIYVER